MVQMAEATLRVLMAIAFVLTPGIVFWLATTGIAVVVNWMKDMITRPVGKREARLALT